jgi:hypothetical protein
LLCMQTCKTYCHFRDTRLKGTTCAGIDVTQAELIAQTTWRRQEKTEMVGAWKAKIYDMHNVQVGVLCSLLSR